ncbi:hypothetical protein BOTBODRAFT_479787 [Botryobasidium botryosum FD-172 SS1]|uniref:Uncharacterized protein n=1 Tax=Botryobasidium botryosum (strain FD-172 SS1) TaxID=930990 RepID=A0A067MW69_BOTB1|nr:hypothetical protein BOTBODRAFT_479787 [Botryobasidium botryosum FD-172 SS1]
MITLLQSKNVTPSENRPHLPDVSPIPHSLLKLWNHSLVYAAENAEVWLIGPRLFLGVPLAEGTSDAIGGGYESSVGRRKRTCSPEEVSLNHETEKPGVVPAEKLQITRESIRIHRMALNPLVLILVIVLITFRIFHRFDDFDWKWRHARIMVGQDPYTAGRSG